MILCRSEFAIERDAMPGGGPGERGAVFLCEPRGAVTERRPCPLLELDRSLAVVESGCKPAVRRHIARGRRQGVRVDVDPGIPAVRAAYPIYRARMRHLRATVQPSRPVEALVREAIATPFLARHEGNTIGLLILLVCPSLAMYRPSAIDPASAGLRPMNALLDGAIRWAHENGIGCFGFGDSHGHRPGFVRFKRGWGPTDRYGTRIMRPYRRWTRRTWRLLEPTARQAYAAWQWSRDALRPDGAHDGLGVG